MEHTFDILFSISNFWSYSSKMLDWYKNNKDTKLDCPFKHEHYTEEFLSIKALTYSDAFDMCYNQLVEKYDTKEFNITDLSAYKDGVHRRFWK